MRRFFPHLFLLSNSVTSDLLQRGSLVYSSQTLTAQMNEKKKKICASNESHSLAWTRNGFSPKTAPLHLKKLLRIHNFVSGTNLYLSALIVILYLTNFKLSRCLWRVRCILRYVNVKVCYDCETFHSTSNCKKREERNSY